MSQLDELEDIVNELEDTPESVEMNKFDYDN